MVDPVTNNHVVNLAVAQKLCLKCENLYMSQRCKSCQEVYYFDNIDDYCDWALKQKNTIQIAHNMQGYDGLFIYKYIIDNLCPFDSVPETIVNGTKLIYMSFREIKFIDSCSFLKQPLSIFPETFGLKEMKKGYFPHLFNTKANQNYVGPYPDKVYYQSHFMTDKKRLFLTSGMIQKEMKFLISKKNLLNIICLTCAFCLKDVCVL